MKGYVQASCKVPMNDSLHLSIMHAGHFCPLGKWANVSAKCM